MAFDRNQVSELLAKCHRRCCICHRFCGVKIETHHTIPGNDDIENAIPVCFECHAEIKLYDPTHPRGRRFQEDELKIHKKQWLDICQNNKSIFLEKRAIDDVGPLQSLIDELEYNINVSKYSKRDDLGCKFREVEFNRTITQGLLSLLPKEIKEVLIETYRRVSRMNSLIASIMHTGARGGQYEEHWNKILEEIPGLESIIQDSHKKLLEFLKCED
jgi:hypothetical protein